MKVCARAENAEWLSSIKITQPFHRLGDGIRYLRFIQFPRLEDTTGFKLDDMFGFYQIISTFLKSYIWAETKCLLKNPNGIFVQLVHMAR